MAQLLCQQTIYALNNNYLEGSEELTLHAVKLTDRLRCHVEIRPL